MRLEFIRRATSGEAKSLAGPVPIGIMARLMRALWPVLPLFAAGCFLPATPTTAPGPTTETQGATAPPQAGPPSAKGAGPEAPTVKTPDVDASKRFEYVDVYVNEDDPDSKRQLAPYMLDAFVNVDTSGWTLDRMRRISGSQTHYRFRRLIDKTTEKSIETDPLDLIRRTP